MTVLPQEVWELVVSYIPRPQWLTLVSVNRALFNIVLDERYGSIEWVKLDAQTAQYLVRLQDRDIARRVRRLHIRAWFLQYLFTREKLFHQTAHDTRFYGLKKRMSRLFKIPLKAPVVATSKQIALVNRLGGLASWREILRAMDTAIGHMVNVTQYKFEWGDIVLDGNTQPLLLATRRAFDTSLAKLVLHARVSQFEDLLSIMTFRSLEELELHFDFDPKGVGKDGIDILAKKRNPVCQFGGPVHKRPRLRPTLLGHIVIRKRRSYCIPPGPTHPPQTANACFTDFIPKRFPFRYNSYQPNPPRAQLYP